jgi:hypothetical protein
LGGAAALGAEARKETGPTDLSTDFGDFADRYLLGEAWRRSSSSSAKSDTGTALERGPWKGSVPE